MPRFKSFLVKGLALDTYMGVLGYQDFWTVIVIKHIWMAI